MLDWPMPLRGALLALVLVLATAPAWAVKDWYDFYQDGKQQVERGRCKEALADLAQARRLKPSSDLEVRLYGLVFIDYLPYYYEGVCHVKTGDFKAALAAFDAEEKQGAIQKNRELLASLGRLRGEAKKALDDAAAAERAAEAEKKARAMLEELQRLRREGDELYRQGKLDEALSRLLEAQKVAEGLADSATQRDIMELVKKIRTEANDRQEAEARTARIQRDLAEEWNPQLGCRDPRATLTKDIVARVAMRADVVAHVLDNAENRHARLLEHAKRL